MGYSFCADTQSVGFLSQPQREQAALRLLGEGGLSRAPGGGRDRAQNAAGLWRLLRDERAASRAAPVYQHLDAAVQLDLLPRVVLDGGKHFCALG